VKSEDSDGKNAIFVSKLGPPVVTDSDLIALFRHIGPVVSASLQKASNGRSKGWG
jgi:RNA recognition motif-containing protein